MRETQAHAFALSIRHAVAFTVTGCTSRRGINQNARAYEFPDGSRLMIYRDRARAFDASGICTLVTALRANAFGAGA